MSKKTFIIAALVLILTLISGFSVQASGSIVEVFTDQTTFLNNATGTVPITFPTDASTALSNQPFGFNDHSCTDNTTGIDLGPVTIIAPAANSWICFIGSGWDAGLSNTNPTPTSPTIVANGEDDYHVVEFAEPVSAVGFELLTNFSASESITFNFADGESETIGDSDLNTAANQFEFVGFQATKPIISVEINTTDGASQNEGISGIWVLSAEGPITSNVAADPNPVAVNGSVVLTANVDDTETGGSDIASAEYSLDGGSWTVMDAKDGAFDAVSEDVTVGFTAPGTPGILDLCVRGTDALGKTGAEECIMLVVYDPDGGFVTGGGWIDSPAGAYEGDNGTIRVDANPDDGWGFNAEPPFVTPAGFTGDEASIGSGSIHVAPITNDPSADAKFILRYVPDSEILVEDFDSFSIDFLIDDVGSSTDANQFYVNFYTLTPDPDDGSWYDCRFDYIASSGSITTWTPLSFSDSEPADAKGDNLSGTCPSSPSGMPAGSTVLFISVNLGDTSFNDSGVGGYFDNAQLTVNDSTTTWDFEEPLTGRANFGFVSKYKKGADVPTGNTEFQFKAADLNFHSSAYEWLVVTGSDYAKFKGEGTINGEVDENGNPFKFQLWAGDGDPDTFRIKIWWEEDDVEHVVYDNGMDQEIGGGNIVVHSK